MFDAVKAIIEICEAKPELCMSLDDGDALVSATVWAPDGSTLFDDVVTFKQAVQLASLASRLCASESDPLSPDQFIAALNTEAVQHASIALSRGDYGCASEWLQFLQGN